MKIPMLEFEHKFKSFEGIHHSVLCSHKVYTETTTNGNRNFQKKTNKSLRSCVANPKQGITGENKEKGLGRNVTTNFISVPTEIKNNNGKFLNQTVSPLTMEKKYDDQNSDGFRIYDKKSSTKSLSPIQKAINSNASNGKLTKAPTPTLQSILKKSIPVKGNHNRRPSSVGFKDEEPTVIGYGGRDFSKEDLEWEMASSDGEGGTTSLDETEDDKAFSKVTKDNTYFNSNNTNLQEQNALKTGKNITSEDAKIDLKCTQNSNETHVVETQATISNGTKENKYEDRNGAIDTHTENCTEIKSTKTNAQREIVNAYSSRHENIQENVVSKNNTHNKTDESSAILVVNGVTKNEGKTIVKYEVNVDYDDVKKSDISIKMDEVNNEPGSEEPMKVQEVSCDAVSVKTTFTTHVICDENNAAILNGASVAPEYGSALKNSNSDCPLPSLGVSCSIEEGTEFIAREKDFGDEFLDLPNDSSKSDNSNCFHEAINTTLAALQSMGDEQEIQISELNKDNHVIESNTILHSSDDNADFNIYSSVDVKGGNQISSEENEKVTSNGVHPSALNLPCKDNMKPRVSFLHGPGSDYKEESPIPNAIYAPGADFFVSRRNSSSSISSSSSDERENTLTEHVDFAICNVSITDGQLLENDGDKQLNIELNNIKNSEMENSHVLISSINSNLKIKPEIPLKPRKAQTVPEVFDNDTGHYAKPLCKPSLIKSDDSKEKIVLDSYYSAAENACEKLRENHYAESNIYHEINNKVLAIIRSEDHSKDSEARESKLAALAIELEQVRLSNVNAANSKRQAPSPPKVPDPPQEEPPSSLERSSSPVDTRNLQNVYRGDAVPFSSSSSTTSSSSQDDAGFCSWALQGDAEDNAKSSKWKNSFLLSKYSKCKMLAMGYNDDKSKSKKKFSLKKLLKLGKDAELPLQADINSANRKAWKYNDRFDRPRPKLDIIHPMDLENKSLTVNPGFDPTRSSTSSFTSGVEVISIRNSTSSDYGTYYSDSISQQEAQGESNYEYVTPERCHSSAAMISSHPLCGSPSPTPSLCSVHSQASTLTSGSSKNSPCLPSNGRPPKPPPPPRAHSLLPGNKNAKSIIYKQSLSDDQSSSGGSVFAEENDALLPQVPRRHFRPPKSDYDTKSLDFSEQDLDSQNYSLETVAISVNGKDGTYELVEKEYQSQQYEDVEVNYADDARSKKEPSQEMGTVSEREIKPSPLTKAPAKPPPIYSKLSNGGGNAWKTLEGSYTALANNNREVLMKLVEQAVKRRPFWSYKDQENVCWQDFKLDTALFSSGDQVVYDAVLRTRGNFHVTLIITLRAQQQSHFSNVSQMKYPVFNHFLSNVPSYLLLDESREDSEMENVQASISVLYRSDVTSLENYIRDLPDVLNENFEKELAFILLQMIQELKGFQVQGIEELDASFKTLLLAKTSDDVFHSLVFTQHDFFEESGNAYSLALDDSKLSLCQYALALVFQLFKVESIEELSAVGALKFSKQNTMKVFQSVAYLLSEEKAVSLSQSKTLLECFLWNVQSLVKRKDFSVNEVDVALHRWIDIERSTSIKNLVNNSMAFINSQTELHSQFLIRTTIRNIKDILSYL